MAELDPVLIDENSKTLDGPVVWVDKKLHERTDLRGPIPAIRTVDYRSGTFLHAVNDLGTHLEDAR